MKKIITILLVLFVSLSTFAGIISVDGKNGTQAPPRDFPPSERHGVGLDLGWGKIGGNLLAIYTYTNSNVTTVQEQIFREDREDPIYVDRLVSPFGFRFTAGIGTNYLIPSLRFSLVPEWIFAKFLVYAGNKTTDVLDLSLGGGLDFDVKFQDPANSYHIALFGAFGITYSFFNHWVFFLKSSFGYGFVSETFKNHKNGFYYNVHIGFNYEF